MALRSDLLDKALAEKKRLVERHNDQSQRVLAEIKARTPRLTEIDNRLAAIGASLPLLSIAGRLQELDACRRESAALSREKKLLLETADYPAVKPLCELCGDTGFTSGAPCDCVRAIAVRLALEEFYRDCPADACAFDNFRLDYYPEEAKKRMTSIFNLCKTYADTLSTDSPNLLFMGKSGLGKTHLTLAIAKAGIEKGLWVVYGSAQNLFAAAEKEHFSFGGSTEETDRLLDCDLLILDDLGTEFNSAFSQSLFYNLVNTRLLRRRPTVINTNLEFDELERRYTARITSRFTGDYLLKQFLGNDIRQIKAMERLGKS